MFGYFFIITIISFLNSNILVESLEVRSFSASSFDSFDPLLEEDYLSSIKRGTLNQSLDWLGVEKNYDSLK